MFWPQSQAFSMSRILVDRRRLGFLRKPWDAFGVGCCVVVFYNCCFELPFTNSNSLFAENATKQAGNELSHLHFHGFISPRRYYYFGLKFGFLRYSMSKIKGSRQNTYIYGWFAASRLHKRRTHRLVDGLFPRPVLSCSSSPFERVPPSFYWESPNKQKLRRDKGWV